jgi:hypothetical protein
MLEFIGHPIYLNLRIITFKTFLKKFVQKTWQLNQTFVSC